MIIEPVVKGDVSHITLHSDTPTDLEELQKSEIQLKEELIPLKLNYMQVKRKCWRS